VPPHRLLHRVVDGYAVLPPAPGAEDLADSSRPAAGLAGSSSHFSTALASPTQRLISRCSPLHTARAAASLTHLRLTAGPQPAPRASPPPRASASAAARPTARVTGSTPAEGDNIFAPYAVCPRRSPATTCRFYPLALGPSRPRPSLRRSCPLPSPQSPPALDLLAPSTALYTSPLKHSGAVPGGVWRSRLC